MIVIQILGWVALFMVSTFVMALLLELFLGGH
nr:MAG TPA: PetN [Caudoviricetes sp.]